MKKRDELLPSRPGRRSWTRAEDYLPQRRARRAPARQLTARPAQEEEADGLSRPLLGLIPFALLMFGLAVMAVAVAVAAWPGRRPVAQGQAAANQAAATGTAAPGWLERR